LAHGVGGRESSQRRFEGTGNVDRAHELHRLTDALNAWHDWATGRPTTNNTVVSMVRDLEVQATSPDDPIAQLAAAVRASAPQHRITIEPPMHHPTPAARSHGIGLER
jgi:hypothetical protein